jgi:hypothetical protein
LSKTSASPPSAAPMSTLMPGTVRSPLSGATSTRLITDTSMLRWLKAISAESLRMSSI